MLDWMPAALSPLDLTLLVALMGGAGVVYGFAGFGSALIFLPIAAILMPLETAIVAFNIGALASVVSVFPAAVRQVDKTAVSILIGASLFTVPIGLIFLKAGDPIALRWGVVIATFLTLVALVSGWRYSVTPTNGVRAAIGAATGLLGGATGLMGPIMILFQLSGQSGAAQARANTLVFLTTTSFLVPPIYWLNGLLTAEALYLGAILWVPYAIGTRIGGKIFNPMHERLYRWVAYVVILLAVIVGLPVDIGGF